MNNISKYSELFNFCRCIHVPSSEDNVSLMRPFVLAFCSFLFVLSGLSRSLQSTEESLMLM